MLRSFRHRHVDAEDSSRRSRLIYHLDCYLLSYMHTYSDTSRRSSIVRKGTSSLMTTTKWPMNLDILSQSLPIILDLVTRPCQRGSYSPCADIQDVDHILHLANRITARQVNETKRISNTTMIGSTWIPFQDITSISKHSLQSAITHCLCLILRGIPIHKAQNLSVKNLHAQATQRPHPLNR